MNTSQNKVYPIFRDERRERAMLEAYATDVRVMVENVLDPNGDWVEATIHFYTNKNNEYILKEVFKNGSDNSTDHVLLTIKKDDKEVVRRFNKFIDAEIYMVSLIEGE